MTSIHLIRSDSSLPTDASVLESSISARERSIATLDKSSEFWERLLPWFTALVVVGVAIEIVVIWLEHRDATDAWKRGVIKPPDKPSLRLLIWALIGSIMVTLGVAGELGIGVTITRINGELRSKNADLRSKSNQLLALVTQEAGDAKKSAEGAADAASRAKEEADATARLADEVQGRADQIVAAIRRPTLSKDEIKAISDRLRPCANPHVRVVIVSEFFNGLGIPVWQALKNGGFDKAEPPHETGRVWYGTRVSSSDSVDDSFAAGCIQSALIPSGKFTIGLLGIGDPPGSPVTVTIGDEPIGNVPDTKKKQIKKQSVEP